MSARLYLSNLILIACVSAVVIPPAFAGGAESAGEFARQQKECAKIMAENSELSKRAAAQIDPLQPRHDYTALCKFGTTVNIPLQAKMINNIKSRPDVCLPDDPVVIKVLQVLSIIQENMRRAVASDCANASQAQASKEEQRGRCANPGPGRTIPHDDGTQCIQATNTNSEQQCKYQFSYISSINGLLSGPVVDPTKTDHSVCGRPGEGMTFEAWHLIPPSAR